MHFSVAIPSYNGRKYLEKTLPAILNLDPENVVISDDCSTDGTVDFLKQNYPQIKLIEQKKNLGFPRNSNAAMSAADSEFIFLFNQDVLPESNLARFSEDHFKDPNCFAVTFNEGERSWAKAEIKSGLLQFENGPRDTLPHKSFWPSGGGSVFRKSMWDKLGGFDQIFSPGYFEDLDIGWRAQKMGWHIVWEPKAKINHFSPEATFNSTFNSKNLTRIKDRNYLLAHWKNLPLSQLPTHFLSVFKRVIMTPGYIVPVLMAIKRYVKV